MAPHSIWGDIAFGFTTSGGPIGFFILLILTGVFYTLSEQTIKRKLIVFAKTILSLTFIFGVLGWINEHYTKPIMKLQRPSHVYMLKQTNCIDKIDTLYELSKKERCAYFSELIKNNQKQFEQIDHKIQEHWIVEAGFSFPSGHTFNAFLFAMMISYALYFNKKNPKWKKFYFVPFIWALGVAISRVAMGAHTALDVSAGAGLGIFLGSIFLYFDHTRHWLTRRQ